MSYSNELIHSNGTTLIFPRYLGTLPYVYTRGHSSPRSSTLPPPLSSYPTSRRTARMSVIPVIESDLAERARIAAFNLDDYQDDPESPPPSPLSPHLFATYQKMIKMAPRRRPTVNRNPPVNRLTNRNTLNTNSGIDTQILNQLIDTRVAEALAAATEFRTVMQGNFWGTKGAVGLTRWFEKLETQFGISNVAEGDRVKFYSSTLLDSALTWWNVYVHFITLNTAHTTPWNDFKAMFIQKYRPRNEVKQMENKLWNLKKMAPRRRPTVNQNPPVNRLTNRNTLNINSGIDTQILNQLIDTRVAEALVAATVTHVASTQEENNLRSNTS
nr:reverse transcriptase domain-containing protein [Tanacetum cinerariifolium]